MSGKRKEKLKMYKEVIISIIIVITIITGNVLTRNYTKSSIDRMNEELAQMREELIKEERKDQKLVEQMSQLDKKWQELSGKLAYYIEHDELEKVQTELVALKANIDTQEYETGIENLDRCKFILDHIKDKEALKIKNIF